MPWPPTAALGANTRPINRHPRSHIVREVCRDRHSGVLLMFHVASRLHGYEKAITQAVQPGYSKGVIAPPSDRPEPPGTSAVTTASQLSVKSSRRGA
jgi:hypothetical protein